MKLFFTRINECNLGREDWQWALLLLFSWFSNFIYYCIVTLGFHNYCYCSSKILSIKHPPWNTMANIWYWIFFSFKETRIKSTQGLVVCLTKTHKGTFSLVCHFKLLNIIIIDNKLSFIYYKTLLLHENTVVIARTGFLGQSYSLKGAFRDLK